MISVDLMTAVTSSPTLRPRSSTLCRVMTLSMRFSPTRTPTFAVTTAKNNGLHFASQLITRRYLHAGDCMDGHASSQCKPGEHMTVKADRIQIAPARWPEDTGAGAHSVEKLRGVPGIVILDGPPACAFPVMRQSFAGYRASMRGKGQTCCWRRSSGEGAGCVAITRRVLKDGMDAAEMKRLWVEPRFRGHGLGRGW